MSHEAFTLAGPAPEDSVATLRAQFPRLPEEYFSFLSRSNGGEGCIGVRPGYAVLWAAQEVARFSSEYEVEIYLPGHVAVGTSGGGDLLVFSLSGLRGALLAVPAIGMAPDVLAAVAPSFAAFAAEFGGVWEPHV
jgi:hypothetical protein